MILNMPWKKGGSLLQTRLAPKRLVSGTSATMLPTFCIRAVSLLTTTRGDSNQSSAFMLTNSVSEKPTFPMFISGQCTFYDIYQQKKKKEKITISKSPSKKIRTYI